LPLPILARPVPDRASLEDATAAYSATAATTAPPVWRTKPAPFLRLNLPDPYENRRPSRLPALPGDETVPRTTWLKTP
jgi:hypothetical protein